MQLLAAVAGGFAVAAMAWLNIVFYRPEMNVAIIFPAWMMFGWIIWRGNNSAWYRVWVGLAVSTWLLATPGLLIVYNHVPKLPENLSWIQMLFWSFGAGVAEAILEIVAQFLAGTALLFSVLAWVQYYRMKRLGKNGSEKRRVN